jgi:hypothetical protein
MAMVAVVMTVVMAVLMIVVMRMVGTLDVAAAREHENMAVGAHHLDISAVKL